MRPAEPLDHRAYPFGVRRRRAVLRLGLLPGTGEVVAKPREGFVVAAAAGDDAFQAELQAVTR